VQVTPQLIARIHTREVKIKRLLHNLLAAVGQRHPQALVYPLTVASKSAAIPRRVAAIDLMRVLRQRHGTLIDQAEMVSQELIRWVGACWLLLFCW
jgi:FKBP12-rapamycin complex-associated protein